MHKILKILLPVICICLYLIIGALVPFANYQELSEEAKAAIQTANFFEERYEGERARIIETGEEAWEERIRLFHRAKERIVLTTFDMRDGESTRDILSVIRRKAEEGVKVQILVDGLSGFLRMEGNPLFYAVSSHPNIEIRLYNPINLLFPWKLQGRMHDKYVMIDQETYMIGGRNSFDYFIGTYEQEYNSLDREVLVYHPQADQKGSIEKLNTYFESVWNMNVCRPFHDEVSFLEHPKVKESVKMLETRYEKLTAEYPELFQNYDYTETTVPIEGVELVTNPTGIYGKEPVVFYTLVELMKQAETSAELHTPYIVCNDFMYQALTETASAVPEARMVINSVANGDNVVASSDYMKNKSKIIETGFEIYEYDGGTSSHGKSLRIDSDISVVGSYNFDLRSTYMDTETMLVIKSKALAEELSGHLEILKKDCRRVIDEETYETPEHILVQPIPLKKQVILKFLGFVLTPFRYVI